MNNKKNKNETEIVKTETIMVGKTYMLAKNKAVYQFSNLYQLLMTGPLFFVFSALLLLLSLLCTQYSELYILLNFISIVYFSCMIALLFSSVIIMESERKKIKRNNPLKELEITFLTKAKEKLFNKTDILVKGTLFYQIIFAVWFYSVFIFLGLPMFLSEITFAGFITYLLLFLIIIVTYTKLSSMEKGKYIVISTRSYTTLNALRT